MTVTASEGSMRRNYFPGRKLNFSLNRATLYALYTLLRPASLAEENQADQHDHRLRDDHRDEDAIDMHRRVHRQPPGQGISSIQKPKRLT